MLWASSTEHGEMIIYVGMALRYIFSRSAENLLKCRFGGMKIWSLFLGSKIEIEECIREF